MCPTGLDSFHRSCPAVCQEAATTIGPSLPRAAFAPIISPMATSSYRERDHAFGRLVLSWRTALRLTQSALAKQLRVSRKTVGAWEAGLIYPTAEHLQHLIALVVERRALAAGREREQIAVFWQAA